MDRKSSDSSSSKPKKTVKIRKEPKAASNSPRKAGAASGILHAAPAPTPTTRQQEGLVAYLTAASRLSSEDRIQDLLDQCRPDVRFYDPFHAAEGHEAVRKIYLAMLSRLDVEGFAIEDIACSAKSPATAYTRWTMTAHSLKDPSKDWSISGSSMIIVDEAGKVRKHVDYWDAGSQFYARLPILKQLIEFVRKKVVKMASSQGEYRYEPPVSF